MTQKMDEVLALCDKLFSQGYDKDGILNRLEMDAMSQAEKARVFMHVDDLITKSALANQVRSTYSIQFVIGVILFSMGSLITVGTFLVGKSQFVLAYGLILSGAWLAKEGYKKNRSTIDVSANPKIRRKKRKW